MTEAPSWVEKRALEEIQKHGWSFQEALYAYIAKHETEPVDHDIEKARELLSGLHIGLAKRGDVERAILAGIKWAREQ